MAAKSRTAVQGEHRMKKRGISRETDGVSRREFGRRVAITLAGGTLAASVLAVPAGATGGTPISAKISRSGPSGEYASGCARPTPEQSHSSASGPAPSPIWGRCLAEVGAERIGTHARDCVFAVGQIS